MPKPPSVMLRMSAVYFLAPRVQLHWTFLLNLRLPMQSTCGFMRHSTTMFELEELQFLNGSQSYSNGSERKHDRHMKDRVKELWIVPFSSKHWTWFFGQHSTILLSP